MVKDVESKWGRIVGTWLCQTLAATNMDDDQLFCVCQTLAATNMDDEELTESMQKLLIVMQRLDQKIAPMLEADGDLFNKR